MLSVMEWPWGIQLNSNRGALGRIRSGGIQPTGCPARDILNSSIALSQMAHFVFPISHFRLQRGANKCPQCVLTMAFGEACIDADQAAVPYPKPFAIFSEHQTGLFQTLSFAINQTWAGLGLRSAWQKQNNWKLSVINLLIEVHA